MVYTNLNSADADAKSRWTHHYTVFLSSKYKDKVRREREREREVERKRKSETEKKEMSTLIMLERLSVMSEIHTNKKTPLYHCHHVSRKLTKSHKKIRPNKKNIKK